jgi:hypothetical protein
LNLIFNNSDYFSNDCENLIVLKKENLVIDENINKKREIYILG